MVPTEDTTNEIPLWAAREVVTARAWRQLQDAASLAPSLPGKNLPRVKFWDDCGSVTNSSEPWTLTVFESCTETKSVLLLREAKWKMMYDYQVLPQLTQNPMGIIAFQPTIHV